MRNIYIEKDTCLYVLQVDDNVEYVIVEDECGHRLKEIKGISFIDSETQKEYKADVVFPHAYISDDLRYIDAKYVLEDEKKKLFEVYLSER